MRHVYLIFAVMLLVANTACAASFDCTKASTKVEKMICADPELSKLDEKLGKVYSGAIKKVSGSSDLKQKQRDWIKERNKCLDIACVKGAYEGRIEVVQNSVQSAVENVSAEQTFPQMPSKLRYTFCDRNKPELYCEGQTGKGYSVCEAYLKHLKTLSSPPTCEAPIPSGFKLPDWEEMDVMRHLDLAYQAEGYFLKRWGGYKHPDFEVWRQTFLKEIKEGKINPHMQKAKVTPNDKGDAAIVSYSRNRDACRISYGSDLQYDRETGRRVGLPSNSVWSSQGGAGQLWNHSGSVHFILPDDTSHKLQEIVGDASRTMTDMLLYSGRPYFVGVLRGYSPLYKNRDEQVRMSAGLVDGKSITWMDNSGIVIHAFDPRFPDDRPNLDLDHYLVGKRCQFLPY